ncbi:MAG: hypothetical protein Q8P79_02175 [Nanoarchaeota archaeon]|nr:hypothetical protein [Nanoarchaeota archaeon]
MSREQIWRDIRIMESGIDYLSRNPTANKEVVNGDYIRPDVNMEIVLPLKHPHGLHMYFLNIRDVLKKAVEKGFLEECDLPLGAPQYLEELVR